MYIVSLTCVHYLCVSDVNKTKISKDQDQRTRDHDRDQDTMPTLTIHDVTKSSLVIFSVKIHVKLPHDSLFAVKMFIDFSEN